MTDGSPTVRRRMLGERLRRARVALGLTGTRVAEILEISQSKVSRIEGGESKLRPKELREFLDLYQVAEDERAELVELGRDTGDRGWWLRYAPVLTRGYASYIGHEDAADEIGSWEPALVPGHLQTEGYFRAMMDATRGLVVPAEHVEPLIELRAERQQRLMKRRVKIEAAIDESALRRTVGSREVTAEQHRHLLDLSAEPHVDIRIVPYTAGAASVGWGGITIMRYSIGLTVVWGEMAANETSIEQEHTDRCVSIYEHLRRIALDPETSRAMLRAALERSAT